MNEKMIDKLILTFKLTIIFMLLIGFVCSWGISNIVGNVVGRAQRSHQKVIKFHTEQINTELKIGSVFKNKENLQVTIIDKQYIDDFLMLELSINTEDVYYENFPDDNILNHLKSIISLRGYSVARELKDDEDFMRVFLNEGGFERPENKLHVLKNYKYIPYMEFNKNNNGMIQTFPSEKTNKLKNYSDVYYGNDSRVKIYINDKENAFLVLSVSYDSAVTLVFDKKNDVDNSPMNIYIPL